MSATFKEDKLQFEFDSEWKVMKWDDHSAYRDGLHKFGDTKAVDFVGLHHGVFWFVEVKDFRDYRIQNKKRLTSGELAEEVACKVRDTLAAMIWACRRAPLDKDDLRGFLRPLVDRTGKVPVVIWLEEDRPPTPAEASVLAQAIKKALVWLNPRVIVTSRSLAQPAQIQGLTVTSLP